MSNKILSIQALRGVAAWMVVFGHAIAFAALAFPQNQMISARKEALQGLSHAGVDVFFVISGAIMLLITTQKPTSEGGDGVGGFLVKRALRIFPLFWAAVVFRYLAGGLDEYAPKPIGVWILDLLLIYPPAEYPPAWTLFFEVRFYVFVAVVLLLYKDRVARGFLYLSLLGALCIILRLCGLLPELRVFHPIMSEFIFGIAVAALYANHVRVRPATALFVGLVWFVAALYLAPPADRINDYRVVGFGLPAALILYGLMTLEREARVWVPRTVKALGDTSYSVYLVHYTVFEFATKMWFIHSLDPASFFVFGFIVTIGVSYLTFRFLEVPSMRLARLVRRSAKGRPEMVES